MNIAIIDSDKNFCSHLSQIIKNLYNHELLVCVFDDIVDMENVDQEFKIIFLNADDPKISGLKYSKMNYDKIIVFIADTAKNMKKAFGPNVYAFILKSDDCIEAEVEEVLATIIEQNYIVLNIHRENKYFFFKDILYVQYIGSNNVAFVYHNQQYIYKGCSLKKMQSLLKNQFIHVDQSTLVNKDKMIHFNGRQLYIDGIRQSFDVSVRNRTKIRKAMFRQ